MSDGHAELVRRNREVTLASWVAQSEWDPLSMARAEGVYFWDADGRRYLDWSSQLFNVNIGHQHPHVIRAIQDQAARLSYAYPGIATAPRVQLAAMLLDILPPGFQRIFFTLGGADAIENAMKMARLSTGKQKVITRYRAYHGATFGAMSAGGDPRRLANEPGVPWIVRVHDPYAYRSPIYRGRTQEEGDRVVADLIEETLLFEGPDNVAALLLEGYSGSSGVIQGGPVFWERIEDIRSRYGILLIIDEVLSGFGRTGAWFGINHYPSVQPDLIAMAKGLTSGYAPLGAVALGERLSSFFEDHTFWGGLTYSAHPLGCAAGVANLEVYQREGLIENARVMGQKLRQALLDLGERHPSVGDVRGEGLLQVVELVRDRTRREPMSDWNRPLAPAMRKVAASLRAQGVSTFVRWNWIFCCPPLTIQPEQLQEGLEALDVALGEADTFVDGVPSE